MESIMPIVPYLCRMSTPSTTWPNTTCLPLSLVRLSASVKKNCDEFESFPALRNAITVGETAVQHETRCCDAGKAEPELAMERVPTALWRSLRPSFSSLNLRP